MKKTICLAVLLVSLLLSIGCSKNQMPMEMPSDFGFIAKYGVGAKNELDTFKGQYIKDLIVDGTASTPLKLSKVEMSSVYEAMRRMNIIGYPDEYAPGSVSLFQKQVTPYQTYYLSISYGGTKKEIQWEDNNLSNTAGARDLRNLFQTIEHLVETKDEFKKLPPPKGGYQ